MDPRGTPAPEERPPLQLMGHLTLWGCQGGVGVWGVCAQVLGCGEVSAAHTREADTAEDGTELAGGWATVSLSSLPPHREGGGGAARLGEEGPCPSVLLPGAWTEPLEETVPSIQKVTDVGSLHIVQKCKRAHDRHPVPATGESSPEMTTPRSLVSFPRKSMSI